MTEILEAHRKWVETKKKEGAPADLRGADLQGAELLRANLQEADLSFANLEGVRLVGANLRGADLSFANLPGVLLDGANLQGALLGGAVGPTQEQLDQACGDAETRLPSALKIDPCPAGDEQP